MTSTPDQITSESGDPSFRETRRVDTPDLRIAQLTADTLPGHISVLRDRLLNAFDEFGLNGQATHAHSCMAIEEALANAIYHGNLELDSELKEVDATQFSDLARERCQRGPWKDRKVEVTELATPFGLWITIRDQGCGFDVQAAIQRTINPAALLASGRGLVMMRAFADDLLFNARGNEVTLVFYSKRNLDIHELLEQRAETRQAASPSHSVL